MHDAALQMSAMPHGEGWVRLVVSGELDIATARAFGDRLGDELDAADVLVDLRDVGFVDSTGLALILSGVQRAEEAGRRLEFVTPLPTQPRRLLELTGLLDRIVLQPVA